MIRTTLEIYIINESVQYLFLEVERKLFNERVYSVYFLNTLMMMMIKNKREKGASGILEEG